jgi:DUF3037 family protein
MADLKYSLVRFVPNPIRDEPINIGIILHSAAERYFAFHLDLRRAASKFARADKDTMKRYEEQLERIENEETDWDHATFENVRVNEASFLDKLADYFGNKIRFSTPRGCIAENPDATFDVLVSQFVSSGGMVQRRVTKRTIIKQVKEAFVGRGWAEYLKSRPVVEGAHKAYTLPLGIRHSHRRFVEVLRLGKAEDASYRAMAAVSRLWQDARSLQANRPSELCVVVHYADGRIAEGERLLRDDGITLAQRPIDALAGVQMDRLRYWE